MAVTGKTVLGAGIAVVLAAAVAATVFPSPRGAAEAEAPPALPTPGVGTIPTIDSVRGLTLPSEAYRPTPQQLTIVDAAIDRLIHECMAQFDLTWQERPTEWKPDPQMPRMYGIGDMARAEQHGYHLLPEERPDQAATSARDAAMTGQSSSPDPEFLHILTGSPDGSTSTEPSETLAGKEVPAGGCAGQANREVTGADQIDPHMAAAQITFDAYQESKSDPRVIDVVSAWSACMADSGYTYASPKEAYAAWDVTSPTVSAAEIQTAITDMTCKQRTNLIGVWYTIQVAYEEGLIEENLAALEEVQRRWADAARRAALVLGELEQT